MANKETQQKNISRLKKYLKKIKSKS